MDRKVSTANLKVGMYISKLDRPWMQTPFLIQGFFIKDKAEIIQLVEYCEYVFIDTELGEEGGYVHRQRTVYSKDPAQTAPLQ